MGVRVYAYHSVRRMMARFVRLRVILDATDDVYWNQVIVVGIPTDPYRIISGQHISISIVGIRNAIVFRAGDETYVQD